MRWDLEDEAGDVAPDSVEPDEDVAIRFIDDILDYLHEFPFAETDQV